MCNLRTQRIPSQICIWNRLIAEWLHRNLFKESLIHNALFDHLVFILWRVPSVITECNMCFLNWGIFVSYRYTMQRGLIKLYELYTISFSFAHIEILRFNTDPWAYVISWLEILCKLWICICMYIFACIFSDTKFVHLASVNKRSKKRNRTKSTEKKQRSHGQKSRGWDASMVPNSLLFLSFRAFSGWIHKFDGLFLLCRC